MLHSLARALERRGLRAASWADFFRSRLFSGFHARAGQRQMLLEIIMRREVSSSRRNLFDWAKGRPFNGSIAQDPSMFAITTFLIVLSVGILLAHALDAFRQR
jgi:hypothetical protein